MRYVYGVDIGGTTVKLGRFDEEGNILNKFEIPTRTEDSGKHILPDIREAVFSDMEKAGIEKNDLLGIGVAMPGPVEESGLVHGAANLNWDDFNVVQELKNLFGNDVPVKALNDANAAALGEMWKGAGAGCMDLVVVTLGTGIGGGIISNGRILTGGKGSGGEIGHFHLMDGETKACGCGNKGCFEQYCSATGLVRMAKEYLEAHPDEDSALRNEEVSAKNIMDEAKKGDKAASAIARRYGELLGKGLSVVASILDPEMILIGGGVAKAGDILIDLLKDSYRENAFRTAKEVRFALCTLGNDAGICGAAASVLEGAGGAGSEGPGSAGRKEI